MSTDGMNRDIIEQRLKRFVLELIRFIESLPRDQASRVIGAQLMRSGSSMGANYFEARAASSRDDFRNFLTHSLKSANESLFWLDIVIEARKGSLEQAQVLRKEASELASILASSILTLKKRRLQAVVYAGSKI